MTRLRVAVAGMGIGQAHLLSYVTLPDLFEVAAIVEPDDDRRKRAAQDWGVATAVSGLHDLAGLGIDVIDVCTPPWLHEEHVMTALGLGTHVICEKPLVDSLAALDRIDAAAGTAPGSLMPIFQYRWGGGAQRLRSLIDAGLAGPLRLVTAETAWWRDEDYYDVAWRGRWPTEGGGAVHSHAVHLHDLVLWLGGPLRSISAHAATLINDIDTEDTAVAIAELGPGGRAPAFATLSTTLGSVQELSRLRFSFEHVSVESSLEPYDPAAEPWTFSFATPSGADEAAALWTELEPVESGYTGQFTAFHAAVTGALPLPVSLGDARAALELTSAWYQSARSGTRVTLPVSSDDPIYHSLAP